VATDQVGHEATSEFQVTTPATGELLLPVDGERTARRISLRARGDQAAYTGVRFQYRRPPSGTWTDVPYEATALRDERGQPVSAGPYPLTGGLSPKLVWDLPVSFPLGQRDGALQVRALFVGGPGGASKRADVTVDERGLSADNARAPVGAGDVDLLTGNLAVSRDDVSIASFGQALVVSRTYNSRDVTPSSQGPFGPGWTASTPVEEAISEYSSLREVSDPWQGEWIELTLSDGSVVYFDRTADGSYVPEPGFEALKLNKPTGDRFELADLDGNMTVFRQPQGASSWTPHEIRQPSSTPQTTRFTYDVTSGTPRVRRMLAPVPAGVTCDISVVDPASLARGCRALDFVYAGTTSATGDAPGQWGDYVGRLKAVKFTAFDPQSGAMAVEEVARYDYDPAGRLRAAWDPRISPALKETYHYDTDGRLTQVIPPGEAPFVLTYRPHSSEPLNTGRLRSVSRTGPQGTATTTVAYDVPLSGPGAPYAMGPDDVAAWGQTDVATDATAIFPPDQVPADPPAGYSRATVHYLNPEGREVNTVAPGGHTSTVEYDAKGNVVRELSATNRARSLTAGGLSAQRAVELDTRRRYSDDGLRLLEEWGPQHLTKLENGQEVQARRHTVTDYDEGSTLQQPAHLPTTVRVGAQVSGASSDEDVRVTKTSYDWALRKPIATITDASSGGLNLKHQTLYNASTGLVRETRMPRNEQGGDASATQTVYYSATSDFGDGLSDPACAKRPEWANLPCKTRPAAQPATPGLPDLPVTSYEYNRLGQVVAETELVGGDRRVTTTTYDPAGREKTKSISTSQGPRPGLVAAYGFEAAAGGIATDGTGRGQNGTIVGATHVTDGRYGKALAFDGADDQVKVADSVAPEITDRFTVEAWIKIESLPRQHNPIVNTGPNGLHLMLNGAGRLVARKDSVADIATSTATLSTGRWHHVAATKDGAAVKLYLDGQDVTGSVANQTIEATAHGLRIGANQCECNIFHGTIDEVRIYNRAVTDTEIQHDKDSSVGGTAGGSTDLVSYRYDRAGRLTEVHDRPAGEGCTTRTYAYDANSNRLSRTTRSPGDGGACDTTSADQVQTSAYDAADRMTAPGVAYDPFGRMTNIPASHSGGGQLETGYYVNDMVRSQTQDGVTKSWLLDPTLQRHRASVPNAGHQEILHYADDSDSPTWTEQLANGTTTSWTRNIEGIDGDLAAIHDSQTGTTLHLTNLHGDIVATASTDSSTTRPLQTFESDEFGNPGQPIDRRYDWLGGKQRRTELASGVVQMGVRSYVPAMGRFTSVDPVPGGSANAYDYAGQDPVNTFDLDGRVCVPCAVAVGAVAGRAALGFMARRGAAEAAKRGAAREAARRTARAVARERRALRTLARNERLVRRWVRDHGNDYTMRVFGLRIRFQVHSHAGGPHQARHLQVNVWQAGPFFKGVHTEIRHFF
jgi:RHS repeat-associated protein